AAPASWPSRVGGGAAPGGLGPGSPLPMLALSGAGSIVGGYAVARLFRLAIARFPDAATATILQFVSTFGVWIFADRLGLSAIITLGVSAIPLARTAPRAPSPPTPLTSSSPSQPRS